MDEDVPTTGTASTNATSSALPVQQHDAETKKRIVTMEHSVQTFEGISSTRRDRSGEPVMITDALSDVRVK
jgi:hypothetical protein